jgi:Trypsin-like peptidase domain
MKKNAFLNTEKNRFDMENYIFSTVLLKYKDKDNKYIIGTGFIVQYGKKCTDRKGYMVSDYLVSNRHVFEDIEKLEIIFHKKDKNDETKPSLEDFIQIDFDEYKEYLYFHPNEDIDIGVVPMGALEGDYNIYRNPVELYSNEDNNIPNYIKVGNNIAFFGYPHGKYDIENYLPILRRGYIASVPSLNYSGKKEILIDAQMYKGSSGSPVFHIYKLDESKNELHFLGMISEYETYNKSEDEGLSIGLGYVIKREIILDFIGEIDEKISVTDL